MKNVCSIDLDCLGRIAPLVAQAEYLQNVPHYGHLVPIERHLVNGYASVNIIFCAFSRLGSGFFMALARA